MRDYASGFLALILAGVLTMVIGLGLMVSAVRSSDEGRAGLSQRQIYPPASILAMRMPNDAAQRR